MKTELQGWKPDAGYAPPLHPQHSTLTTIVQFSFELSKQIWNGGWLQTEVFGGQILCCLVWPASPLPFQTALKG